MELAFHHHSKLQEVVLFFRHKVTPTLDSSIRAPIRKLSWLTKHCSIAGWNTQHALGKSAQKVYIFSPRRRLSSFSLSLLVFLALWKHFPPRKRRWEGRNFVCCVAMMPDRTHTGLSSTAWSDRVFPSPRSVRKILTVLFPGFAFFLYLFPSQFLFFTCLSSSYTLCLTAEDLSRTQIKTR